MTHPWNGRPFLFNLQRYVTVCAVCHYRSECFAEKNLWTFLQECSLMCPESQCHFFKTFLFCNVCSLRFCLAFCWPRLTHRIKLPVLEGLEYHLSTSFVASIRGYLDAALSTGRFFVPVQPYLVAAKIKCKLTIQIYCTRGTQQRDS